jgi:hypothetical protein
MEEAFMSVQMERYQCPYCDRQSASPGGVRFHVKLEHPEKLEEFNEKYYPEMSERFKQSIASD